MATTAASTTATTHPRTPIAKILSITLTVLALAGLIGGSIYALVTAFAPDNRGKPVEGKYDYSKATIDQLYKPFIASFLAMLALGVCATYIVNRRTSAALTKKQE